MLLGGGEVASEREVAVRERLTESLSVMPLVRCEITEEAALGKCFISLRPPLSLCPQNFLFLFFKPCKDFLFFCPSRFLSHLVCHVHCFFGLFFCQSGGSDTEALYG